MALDLNRLEQVLKLAGAPLVALGTFVGSVAAGIKWLRPILVNAVGPDIAGPLAIAGPALAAILALWLAHNALAKRSLLLRRERFDLRVRTPGDLLGRDKEVANLTSLIEDSALLFVDGESGSGKSSLIEFGLVPALRETGTSVPILVKTYAGDWDTGLAQRIHDAAWAALSAEDRTKAGLADRPAIGTVKADTARAILEAIGGRLGRMPLVVLDQFDDYQLAARNRFLGRRKDWIKPAELIRRNRLWEALRDLLAAGTARLLIITRSDASAGLFSVRLTDDPTPFTVSRLELGWLEQWLDQVTADDGKGAVVRNLDGGWTEVKALLKRDLTPTGSAVALVLPQQVRILFLGLRKLPALTPTAYRRAAAGAGVEALYIRDAIKTAAAHSGLDQDVVRDLLLRLVDRGESSALKTRVLTVADLAVPGADEPRLRRALEQLARDEVMRERPDGGETGPRWQLDHDYLARAVMAEHRRPTHCRRACRMGRRLGLPPAPT
jgi:hypothetical protein